MYPIIQASHSYLAFFVLTLVLAAVINSLIGLSSKREFVAAQDRRLALVALIFTHIQLLVGLVLYFVSPVGSAVLGQMKDASLRLTSLEHPLINIVAVTLITIGWSKHKKAENSASKFKSIAVFYALGLVLILARIPWHLWL